jgi:hypothetical protein
LIPEDTGDADFGAACKVLVDVSMVLPVVVNGFDESLPLLVVVTPDLDIINGHPAKQPKRGVSTILVSY